MSIVQQTRHFDALREVPLPTGAHTGTIKEFKMVKYNYGGLAE
jgi:hypothetical protein